MVYVLHKSMALFLQYIKYIIFSLHNIETFSFVLSATEPSTLYSITSNRNSQIKKINVVLVPEPELVTSEVS